MAVLKLISLNIEKSKHLDRVIPFISRELPDVFCVQELFERDIPHFSKALGSVAYAYVPMTRRINETPPEIQGLATFSRFPIVHQEVHYYQGDSEHVPDSDTEDPKTFTRNNYTVLICDIEKDGYPFRICTTHFTWTPDGKPDDLQRDHIKKLLKILESVGEFVFPGDFNAPRGGEIFCMLAEKYKDNVPSHYKTSLDILLHWAGKTRPRELEDKMVDGIFSTPGYRVSNVEMISGVSDHCALIADVSRSF